MSFVDELLNKSKQANKTIVLCEGEDKRVVEAASKIVKDGIAKIILIGTKEECESVAPGIDLTGIQIVDPRIVAVIWQIQCLEAGVCRRVGIEAIMIEVAGTVDIALGAVDHALKAVIRVLIE